MALKNYSVRLTHENELRLELLRELWPACTRTDFINAAIECFFEDKDSCRLVPCSEDNPSGIVEFCIGPVDRSVRNSITKYMIQDKTT